MAETRPNYFALTDFYEQCFAKHGPTPQGVDWPNVVDLNTRFKVMLDVFAHESANSSLSLLDLGCGYGALLNYLHEASLPQHISYQGIDLSANMIAAAQRLFPSQPFEVRDLLHQPLEANSVDYIVMNGLLTEKRGLAWQEMVHFAQQILTTAFNTCRRGIAFNIMSNQVDWCKTELFHWSLDDVAQFLVQHCSRHFVIRNDYGLYEYTVYVYKSPNL